jgi:hypothetical protein
MEILKYGFEVEALSVATLRKRVINERKKALDCY